MLLDCPEEVQDLPTRWNSKYTMMTRILRFCALITVELPECVMADSLITQEWKLPASVVKALWPLNQAMTTLLGQLTNPSKVIPLLEYTRIILDQHLDDYDAPSIASSLLKSARSRFPDIKMSRLLALAMLVNPW